MGDDLPDDPVAGLVGVNDAVSIEVKDVGIAQVHLDAVDPVREVHDEAVTPDAGPRVKSQGDLVPVGVANPALLDPPAVIRVGQCVVDFRQSWEVRNPWQA